MFFIAERTGCLPQSGRAAVAGCRDHNDVGHRLMRSVPSEAHGVPRPVPGAGHRCAAGVQYRRLQLALITTGTDSVCVMVPSLTQKVMLNEEFA